MSTPQSYVEFVCEQIHALGAVRYKKMFGEYMVYLNDKPIFLVCNATVFIKKIEPVESLLKAAHVGIPYANAKEHYILDIEDTDLVCQVATILELSIPIPKPRKKKSG